MEEKGQGNVTESNMIGRGSTLDYVPEEENVQWKEEGAIAAKLQS